MNYNAPGKINRSGAATTTPSVLGSPNNATYAVNGTGLRVSQLTGQALNADTMRKRDAYFISVPITQTGTLYVQTYMIDPTKPITDPNFRTLQTIAEVQPGQSLGESNFSSPVITGPIWVVASAGTINYYANETFGTL